MVSERRRCSALIAALGLVLCYGVRPVHGQEMDVKRPQYENLRFDENWSILKGVDRGATGDFWDRLKYIPFTQDGSVWLTLGGQVRERVEFYHEYLFGHSEPKQTDAYLLSRFRLSADLHLTPYVRVFAEGKASFALDRDLTGGRTPSYVDEFDLQNGFADINIPISDAVMVTLRGGRQELLFGSQRLVGPSDWSNVRRTWDGAAAITRLGEWTVHPFWAELAVVDKYKFNESTGDQRLWGVFATGPLPGVPLSLDLYWFHARNTNADYNGSAGRENRDTLGGRVWGKIGDTGLDLEVEGAGQFGSVGSDSVAAGMVTTVLGYNLPVTHLSPRVYVEFDYASGDSRPGGTVNTYNQLFPTSHQTLGYIDYIGRQNVLSANGGLSVKPLSDLTLSLQQYFFWRASDRDAVYNKSGGVLREGGSTTARYVGAEIDLLATYQLTRHVLGYAGYSHFFTGEFLKKTGAHKDSDFVYAAIQFTF